MSCARTSIRTALAFAAVAAVAASELPGAHAQDFFTSFFDTMMGRPPERQSQPALSYNRGDTQYPRAAAPQTRPSSVSRSSTAFCVRTCDGRYFPVTANSEQSRAATCKNLCPASETKVFYGSAIDHATSDNGKAYSSLPNAFKYREQLVQGCTCNGKDAVGLASISIEDDKTLRKGDIVAGENGLIVANRDGKRANKTANFTPAPQQIRAKFERAHAMALR